LSITRGRCPQVLDYVIDGETVALNSEGVTTDEGGAFKLLMGFVQDRERATVRQSD